MKKNVGLDDVAEHNRRMWDHLATAAIPYTRPRGTPPKTATAKRKFLDRTTNGRFTGMELRGKRVLSLAGGGGWEPILFAELGADATVFDISAKQLSTVRKVANERGTKLRYAQGDMRDLSRFKDGSFDLILHCHSLVFVPDAERVIREVGRVLAPGGTYVASTMHPVTIRLYETWTGTGWNFKRSYFEDGAMPYKDTTWEFGDVKIDAKTLEYGHRIGDLINACVAANMVIDGFWEWTPEWAIGGGEPGSDVELDHLLPAFIELRARRLPLETPAGASRPPRPISRRGPSRSDSPKGTGSHSR